MKNKAEQLQQAIERLKDAIIAVEIEQLPIPDFVRLYPDDARILLDTMESLRWMALNQYDETTNIGVEFESYDEAAFLGGALLEPIDDLEIIGIIRLKTDEQ